MRVFAYCRVSTTDQSTENQVLEIANAGFALNERRIVKETISGSVPADQRPGFQRLMDKLESEDVLVVTKLDRLGRNAMDVRATVEKLAQNGFITEETHLYYKGICPECSKENQN